MLRRVVVLFVLVSVFSGVSPSRGEGVVCIPASVMLHSRDRYLLVHEMIPWLKEEGYETMTYLDLAEVVRGERSMPKKVVIISMDDLSTTQINSYFVDMINALHENGMRAVLGINDQAGPEENGETYKQLALWSSWGFELATHTSHHANLPVYGDEEIMVEVGGSVDRIQLGTGVRPITLILPYGAGARDERVINASRMAGIQFLVGIPGTNRAINDFTVPIYVPRTLPLDQYIGSIAWEIENWYRFNPECM